MSIPATPAPPYPLEPAPGAAVSLPAAPLKPVAFTGATPYLHYDDIVGMVDWLVRVFGFVEKGRWLDEAGAVSNAELLAGANEIWLDGKPGWWASRGRRPEEWIGIWVDDVFAMHARVTAAGVSADEPTAQFYGVRGFQVTDPEGYAWGFMQRAPYIARHPL